MFSGAGNPKPLKVKIPHRITKHPLVIRRSSRQMAMVQSAHRLRRSKTEQVFWSNIQLPPSVSTQLSAFIVLLVYLTTIYVVT